MGFQLLDLPFVRTEAGLKLSLENLSQLFLKFAATRVIPRRLPLVEQFMDAILLVRRLPG